MDFSMANGPPAFHNKNNVHSWLQQEWFGVEVWCAMSDFGGRLGTIHRYVVDIITITR
jgi:hypothetical protein